MSSLGWDEEVPAGYQDADLLQAQYEEESRQAARLRRKGICTHGSLLGYALQSNGKPYYSREDVVGMLVLHGPLVTDEVVEALVWPPPLDGLVLCTDCGRRVEDPCP